MKSTCICLLFVIVLSLICGIGANEKLLDRNVRPVTLEGAVKMPGSYSLAVGDNLVALVGKAVPLFNARLAKVMIIHGTGNMMSYTIVDFKELVKSEKDFELKSKDRVFVFGEYY